MAVEPIVLANGQEDAAVLLARRAANTTFDDLSEAEVLMTKKSILDTIGVIIGGSGLGNRCLDFVQLSQETGGRGEATILGYGDKVPALHAAAANGAMAHTLDYDDTIPETGHQTAGSMPATLAAAQYVGGISGKEFITAVACGADIVCRLHKTQPVWGTPIGWVGTATTGIFGGAMGAAKAMGLDEEGIVNALGWALWQASFAGEIFNTPGSDAREVYAGFSQSYGFLSALLAKRGMKSCTNSIEGKDGFFNKYYIHWIDELDRGWVRLENSTCFEGVNGQIKPWSSCGQTHSYIQATRELMAENGFKPEDIKEVFVKVGDLGIVLSDNYESRYVPKKANDARFSIPFTIAAAILDGNVTLSCFFAENLPKYYDMAAKVKYEWDYDIAHDPEAKGLEPAYVRITTIDGRVVDKTVKVPYGHPQNPMSMEDIIAKFKDCCSYAHTKIPEEKLSKVVDMVLHLEDVDNINNLVALVS